jgi:hypothetical protein
MPGISSGAVLLAGSFGRGSTTMRYTPLQTAAMHAMELVNQNVMAETARQVNLALWRPNTAKAYDPKAREFYDLCNYKYLLLPIDQRYTVTADKLRAFLTYQAFREKRQRGERKKGVAESFDSAEYNVICTRYSAAFAKLQESGTPIPDPENPLGYSAKNTYCSTGKYSRTGVTIEFS